MAQHISVRVPWKDNGYTGLVCERPCNNSACLRLSRISEKRDDKYEESISGQHFDGKEQNLPCLTEGACFMSDRTFEYKTIHPYANNNPQTHGHFKETTIVYPPYSFPVRPYGWMMKRKGDKDGNIEVIADKYGIDYNNNIEPDLKFNTNWVQDARNQKAILECFREDITPKKSLIIPYAKQVPFIDDAKRVVMGIGYVTSISELKEHNHTNENELRSMLWERMVGHSIRDNRKDGFLMPYREMMEYQKQNPGFDIKSITIFAEDDYFDEFSYAAEWVSYDAVISVLTQMISALEIIKKCIPGNWNECILWTQERLKEIWLERGPYPGLGSMLCAVGISRGELLAREARAKITDISAFDNAFYSLLDDVDRNFSEKKGVWTYRSCKT